MPEAIVFFDFGYDMWLWRLIQIGYGYGTSYLKVERTAPDLFYSAILTRGQIGRFYWINLFLVAFAINLLFVYAQLDKRDADNGPLYPIPFLALFVLAELASLMFLFEAQFLGWLLCRTKLVSLLLQNGVPTRLALQQRIHRLVWGAFPWTLFVAVYFWWYKKSLVRVIELCSKPEAFCPIGSVAFSIRITIATLWPGVVVGTLAAAIVAYGLRRFKSIRIWALIWVWAFLCYAAALAVVGPGDFLHIVHTLRNLHIDSIVTKFIGPIKM